MIPWTHVIIHALIGTPNDCLVLKITTTKPPETSLNEKTERKNTNIIFSASLLSAFSNFYDLCLKTFLNE